MKNAFFILPVLLLIGAGCAGIGQNSVSIVDPVDGDTTVTSVIVDEPNNSDTVAASVNIDEPSDDNSFVSASSTLKGIIEVGRFYGTEMACRPGDDAEIGDRERCNSGGVNIAIRTDEGALVWLKDYKCGATEFIVKAEDGFPVEYDTSNCDEGIVPGDRYLIEGDLEERKDQWYGGKQQDELWMTVKSIERLN